MSNKTHFVYCTSFVHACTLFTAAYLCCLSLRRHTFSHTLAFSNNSDTSVHVLVVMINPYTCSNTPTSYTQQFTGMSADNNILVKTCTIIHMYYICHVQHCCVCTYTSSCCRVVQFVQPSIVLSTCCGIVHTFLTQFIVMLWHYGFRVLYIFYSQIMEQMLFMVK